MYRLMYRYPPTLPPLPTSGLKSQASASFLRAMATNPVPLFAALARTMAQPAATASTSAIAIATATSTASAPAASPHLDKLLGMAKEVVLSALAVAAQGSAGGGAGAAAPDDASQRVVASFLKTVLLVPGGCEALPADLRVGGLGRWLVQ